MPQSQKAISWFDEVAKIGNSELQQFITKYVELCNPDKVFVCTDSDEDIEYIRESAIRNGEESKLAIDGHTIHFDSYYDQGRDREHSHILAPKLYPPPTNRQLQIGNRLYFPKSPRQIYFSGRSRSSLAANNHNLPILIYLLEFHQSPDRRTAGQDW